MTTNSRRSELGAFLRSRRERIRPEQVGIQGAGRRRTPGLRREEVSQLAGVGLTWYTWLEQGRSINASPQVLDAVARVLRLDEIERDHAHQLAGNSRLPSAPVTSDMSKPDVDDLLRAVDPLPAALVNDRTDLLKWNRAYQAMNPELVAAAPSSRNTIWEMFAVVRRDGRILDCDKRAPAAVAGFRYRYSQHLDDPDWQELIARLRATSPLFAQLWATRDVAAPRLCDKRYAFAGHGEIGLRTTGMDLSDYPGVRLVVHTPVDETSRRRLNQLVGLTLDPVAPAGGAS